MRTFLVGLLTLTVTLGGCTSTDQRGAYGGRSDCPSPGDSPGGAGLGDPVFPSLGNEGYDVSHYSLDLTVDPGRNHLSAVVDIQATASQELTSFNLDFAGPSVRGVTVDERQAPFCRDEGELTVVPVDPLHVDAPSRSR